MARSRASAAAVGIAAACGCGSGGCAAVRRPNLVVYSARNEQLIKPMFDRYTAETGQTIRFVTDDAGPLIERLAAEGAEFAGRYSA